MPKNVQTCAQLCSLHMLARKTENPSSEASTIHEHRTSDTQAGFRKGRGTRNQTANICCIIDKARELQKISCFIDYAFDCVDHNKLQRILEEMGTPEHLNCLLENLCAGQEATVRTGHSTMDCSKLGKEYVKAVYCHLAYLTFMQSISCEMAGCHDEAQAGIKISGRNINNLRYADDHSSGRK